MAEFPKGRIFCGHEGWYGDLSNKGDLSGYKGLKYRVINTGDYVSAEPFTEKIEQNSLLSIIGCYRVNLCENDKELCKSVGLDAGTCDEFSFNSGNGFKHFIGISEYYQKNWLDIKSGYIEIGMISDSDKDNRHYLSGEFYLIRVYQKSMTDEEMEEEVSKATRYVNSFVETN